MTAAITLFDYVIDGTTYTENNPTSYDQDYTVTNLTLQASAELMCNILYQGPQNATCIPLLSPDPYFQTCMFDILRRNEVGAGQASLVAYSILCQELGEGDDHSEITGK